MIFGIGTDIVLISRILRSIDKYGEKFAERILSPVELSEYKSSNDPGRLLAKRFAAKEATSKAFGTGFRDGLSLKDIEVGHDELGKPVLCFYNKAEQFIKENGIKTTFISLSDEKEYAVAYVILER